MDRGALWATVHGIAKSQMQLSNSHTDTHTHTRVYVYMSIKYFLQCDIITLEQCFYTYLNSILIWRIPGTEESNGLPSMGSHRVGHDLSDLAAAANR